MDKFYQIGLSLSSFLLTEPLVELPIWSLGVVKQQDETGIQMSNPIDERILHELRHNAKIPITSLAKLVGRSRTAVQARIDRLEASGQINHYTIAEPDRDEEHHIAAIVLVSVSVRNRSEHLVEILKSMPNVTTCLAITGDPAFALMIQRTTSEELNSTIERIYELEGVTKTETIMALKTVF